MTNFEQALEFERQLANKQENLDQLSSKYEQVKNELSLAVENVSDMSNRYSSTNGLK